MSKITPSMGKFSSNGLWQEWWLAGFLCAALSLARAENRWALAGRWISEGGTTLIVRLLVNNFMFHICKMWQHWFAKCAGFTYLKGASCHISAGCLWWAGGIWGPRVVGEENGPGEIMRGHNWGTLLCQGPRAFHVFSDSAYDPPLTPPTPAKSRIDNTFDVWRP